MSIGIGLSGALWQEIHPKQREQDLVSEAFIAGNSELREGGST